MSKPLLKLPKALHRRVRPNPCHAMTMAKVVRMNLLGPYPGNPCAHARFINDLPDPPFRDPDKRSRSNTIRFHIFHDQVDCGVIDKHDALIAPLLSAFQCPHIQGSVLHADVFDGEHKQLCQSAAGSPEKPEDGSIPQVPGAIYEGPNLLGPEVAPHVAHRLADVEIAHFEAVIKKQGVF